MEGWRGTARAGRGSHHLASPRAHICPHHSSECRTTGGDMGLHLWLFRETVGEKNQNITSHTVTNLSHLHRGTGWVCLLHQIFWLRLNVFLCRSWFEAKMCFMTCYKITYSVCDVLHQQEILFDSNTLECEYQ